MTADQSQNIAGCLVQHGKQSDRVYLQHWGETTAPEVLDALEDLAQANGYGKIFAKVPDLAAPFFLAHGYSIEALVPGFYNGREDCLFLCRYRVRERAVFPGSEAQSLAENIFKRNIFQPESLSQIQQDPSRQNGGLPDNSGSNPILLANKEDAIELSQLYAEIFPRYPFPIDDPGFLIQNMEDTFYAIIRDPKSGKILAAASAEMDRTFANAEMTDFAVRPECRGQGLALKLLAWLEDMVREQSICTAYTIARLVQPGMNLTFARSGYRFGGILPNNTWIGDGLESMTVWHKSL